MYMIRPTMSHTTHVMTEVCMVVVTISIVSQITLMTVSQLMTLAMLFVCFVCNHVYPDTGTGVRCLSPPDY